VDCSIKNLVLNLPLFKNPRFDRIMKISEFPQTTEDAADLLAMARSSRVERKYRKLAAEEAVRQGDIQLQVLSRNASDDTMVGIGDLQVLRHELSKATKKLLEADEDVAVARSMIRMKGLPLEFGSEFGPEYQSHPVNIIPYAISDCGSAGGSGSMCSSDLDQYRMQESEDPERPQVE
jgi:hypothetical protein